MRGSINREGQGSLSLQNRNTLLSALRISRALAAGLFEKYLEDSLERDGSRAMISYPMKGRVLLLKDFATHFMILGLGVFGSALSESIRYFCTKTKKSASTPPEKLFWYPIPSLLLLRKRMRRDSSEANIPVRFSSSVVLPSKSPESRIVENVPTQ